MVVRVTNQPSIVTCVDSGYHRRMQKLVIGVLNLSTRSSCIDTPIQDSREFFAATPPDRSLRATPPREYACHSSTTECRSGNAAHDRLCVCPRSSPGADAPNTATANAPAPDTGAGGAAAAGADNASSGTTGYTITLHGDCVLHRQRYGIRHPRLERDGRRGSGSLAARYAHSDYESCALQRNVLGPRYGVRNTQTPFRRLYPRLRRGAAIRPPIRSCDGDSAAALTPRCFNS